MLRGAKSIPIQVYAMKLSNAKVRADAMERPAIPALPFAVAPSCANISVGGHRRPIIKWSTLTTALATKACRHGVTSVGEIHARSCAKLCLFALRSIFRSRPAMGIHPLPLWSIGGVLQQLIRAGPHFTHNRTL